MFNQGLLVAGHTGTQGARSTPPRGRPILTITRQAGGEPHRGGSAPPANLDALRPISRLSQARAVVGIATHGRPDVLAATVRHLETQTLPPAKIILSCVVPGDHVGLPLGPDIEVIYGPSGLTRQRNRILDRLPAEAEFIAFFDDDFLPDPAWLEIVAAAFNEAPDLACVTGHLLADGIMGPGLTFADGLDRLARSYSDLGRGITEGFSPYGCNMAFRCTAIGPLRFDERLVLYGWLEDMDFGSAVARRGGRLIKLASARGVHLGVKGGRVSGRRLGYSQVMNPVYMHRKGTMAATAAIRQVLRNVGSNLLRFAKPERFVDRRGRLHGNAIALLDLLRRRVTPERAEAL